MKIPKGLYTIRIYRNYENKEFHYNWEVRYKWEVNITRIASSLSWRGVGYTITKWGAKRAAKKATRKHYRAGKGAKLIEEILYP